MHYLTQHYKNRCAQLQEQINVLSYQLRTLSEAAAGMQAMGGEAGGSATQEAPTYDGAGLANILNQFFSNPRHAQANLNAYLAAWHAQNAGVGGVAPANLRSTSAGAGRNVAAVARDIMSAGGPAPKAPYTSAAGGMGDSERTGSNIPGDYNGDGRVDGADLGIALGNYGEPGYNFQNTLQNWTGSMGAAGSAGPAGVVAPGARRRRG